MNQAWHLRHRMPRNATREQRVRWHTAHALACACRPIPASVRAEAEKLLQRQKSHRVARPDGLSK